MSLIAKERDSSGTPDEYKSTHKINPSLIEETNQKIEKCIQLSYVLDKEANYHKSSLLEKQHTLDKINDKSIQNLMELTNIEWNAALLLCDISTIPQASDDNTNQSYSIEQEWNSVYDKLQNLNKLYS